MNRLILINLLKKYIERYIKLDFTTEIIEEIYSNEKYIELNENIVAQKEIELIHYLFSKIPYYKIEIFLNSFNESFKEHSKKSNSIQLRSIAFVLEGYISDLLNTIKERNKTEIHYHLLLIARDYYNANVDMKKNVSRITKNICSPNELMSLDIAKSTEFEQLSLFMQNCKPNNLRDEISKNNCMKKLSIKKRLTKFLAHTFSKEDYRNFLKLVHEILELSTEKMNFKEAHQLYDMYEKELTMLYREIHDTIKSLEQRNIELSLIFKRSAE